MTEHNPNKVSENKYIDDLLKQNSLTYQGWMIYRWVYNQLKNQPDRIKDELYTFLGDTPDLKAIENYLPAQKGKSFELRDYQQEAIDSLKSMRERGETIALLYHATGVGKTVTACTDAKNVGGRTLFLVNALKLADQAKDNFVDNANMFKMPYSLHRTLNMSEYRPFEYVLAPEHLRKHDPNTAKGGYTDKDVEKNILSNPFKRFADMRFFQRCKDVTMVRFNPWIYKKLDAEDFKRIHGICDRKLEEYYARFK